MSEIAEVLRAIEWELGFISLVLLMMLIFKDMGGKR